MWISVELEPFLFLQTSGCPPAPALAPLPPGVFVVPHALRTTTAAAASAPSFVSLIQSPPKTVVRKPPERPRSVLPPTRPAGDLRAHPPPSPDFRGRSHRWFGEDPGKRAQVRDGRRRRTLARTARRLPPKRCRIIDTGGPNATPVGATRAWLSSLWLATPRGPVDAAA